MTQEQLASAIGISGPSVSQLETGVSKSPAAATLLKIAAVFDANPDWILDGKGEPFVSSAVDGVRDELAAIAADLPDGQVAALLAAAKALKG